VKIAFIIPSLAHKGPVLVVRDIIAQIYNRVDAIDVYYFDDIREVELNCPTYKIDFSTQIAFDKYDIIHSHMYRPDKYIWKNRRKIKGKTITTMHCDPRTDFRYTYNMFISLIFRWVWLKYISKHDKVVVLTRHMLDTYFRRYIPKNKLSCIYNGISYGELSCIDENDRQVIDKIKTRNYKIIGSNAFLTKRKGLHFVISSLPYLSDYVFIVIGDGKEKRNLIKLAKKLKVDDRCYFLGYKKNAIAYLPYYDIYAMPSISEGFSLALIEAVMQKISCVCSDIELFREIFTQDEVTFFLLGNIQSLVSAISKAYKEKEVKSRNAYRRSLSNYTSKIMGDNYLKLYKTMSD
jgi:glycosyltransferase involved in cell wall biosynthesis